MRRAGSKKRKRRTLPANHGGLSPGITVALTGVSAKGAVGKMRSADDIVVSFLRKRGLNGPFSDAVRAAEGSRVALDDLAVRLKALLELAKPRLERVARRELALRRYRVALPSEKSAIRAAVAVILDIEEESVPREARARRARDDGPGKPGRPKREK